MNIKYTTVDGIELDGSLEKVNDTGKIVILCHGLKSDKSERNSFNELVNKLNEEKVNSFRFDFRGHGASQGKDYEMTPTREVIDLESTISMLEDKGFNKFILLGASFGASIISLVNYDNYKNIKALISWYGVLDYLATIEEDKFFSKEHRNIANENGYYEIISKRTGKSFKLGKNLYDEVYSIVPYEKLIKVDKPILFVHGLADKMVPYTLSEKVSALCKNAKLELIKNGDHTFDNDKKALEDTIKVTVDFIKENLE